jgi:hypothetical protein
MDLQHDTAPFGFRRSGLEISRLQTTEAFQRQALLPGKRFGRQRRGFIATIGLAEERETDLGAVKMVGRREQSGLRRNGTENQVRMFGFGRQELSRCFDRRVACLHRHLRRGDVNANENVYVANLGEGIQHETLLSKK